MWLDGSEAGIFPRPKEEGGGEYLEATGSPGLGGGERRSRKARRLHDRPDPPLSANR